MKKSVAFLMILCLMLPLTSAFAAKAKAPKLKLFTLEKGDTTQPVEGKGRWESQHPDVAAVSENGVITAVGEGYTLVQCFDTKGEVAVRCEVKVGHKEMPAEIQTAIDTAINEWAMANGQPFPKYNKYTKWYNEAAKNGFGWCGAFVGYAYGQSGIEMNPEYKQKKAPPLNDGTPFAVRQASQTKLFEGFQSRNRLTNIPEKGYYIIYGRKGSTPYTHIALITDVQPQGDGVYALQTVEGNLNSRIKRYSYLYDSLAEKKEKNIKPLPQDMRTQGDIFLYDYVSEFYINCFGQTWY